MKDLRHVEAEILDRIGRIEKRLTEAECVPRQLDDISKQIQTFQGSVSDYVREQTILDSLDYHKRPSREDIILTAHEDTFRWLGDREINSKAPDEIKRLLGWLEKDQDIFWISGRPGSGKSTLMKLIAKHKTTDHLLGKWAAGGAVTKACHYFWSVGTEMQRSQEGLLRSLLYDILCDNSELIPFISPSRWQLAKTEQYATNPKPWTLPELQEVVACVRRECDGDHQMARLRVFFLIDGLDEYSGNHRELCESIQLLAGCHGIKLLVASRSWNIFEESFGSNTLRKFYLHDLTKEDIRLYIKAHLTKHPRWDSLAAAGIDAVEIIDTITRRAEGVFLWVFLVVRDLKEGLTDCDDMDQLEARLDNIPDDLGAFFRTILGQVDSIQQVYMARWLKMALAAGFPLPLVFYGLYDMEERNTSRTFATADEPWSLQRWQDFLLPMVRRLNARSKGLLEVHDGEVQFLHRTVRDFLNTGPIQDYLTSKLNSDFDPYLAITGAQVACLCKLDLKAGAGYGRTESEGWLKVSLRSETELNKLGWTTATLYKALLRAQAVSGFERIDLNEQIHQVFMHAEGVLRQHEFTLFSILDKMYSIIPTGHIRNARSGAAEACFWREVFWHKRADYVAAILSRNEEAPVDLDKHKLRQGLFAPICAMTIEDLHRDIDPYSAPHISILRLLILERVLNESADWDPESGRNADEREDITVRFIERVLNSFPLFKKCLKSDLITAVFEYANKFNPKLMISWVDDLPPVFAGSALIHKREDQIIMCWPLWFIYAQKLGKSHQLREFSESYMLGLNVVLESADLLQDLDYGLTPGSPSDRVNRLKTDIEDSFWKDATISRPSEGGTMLGLLLLFLLLQPRRFLSPRLATSDAAGMCAKGLRIILRHVARRTGLTRGVDMRPIETSLRASFPEVWGEEVLRILQEAEQPGVCVVPQRVSPELAVTNMPLRGSQT
jgi:hypothetical protein